MKRIISLLLLLVLISACSSTKSVKQDEIYIKEVNFNQDTYTLTYRIDSTKKPIDITLGVEYLVEEKVKDKWVEVKDMNLSFVEIFLEEQAPYLSSLSLNNIMKYKYSSNTYRLKRNITIGKKNKYVIYNEFKVKDGIFDFTTSSVELLKVKK